MNLLNADEPLERERSGTNSPEKIMIYELFICHYCY